MRVLMFKEQFAEAVKSGTKLQTIRPPRKRPINVNDVLSLRKWTGRPYASKQQCLAIPTTDCQRLQRHLTKLASLAEAVNCEETLHLVR